MNLLTNSTLVLHFFNVKKLELGVKCRCRVGCICCSADSSLKDGDAIFPQENLLLKDVTVRPFVISSLLLFLSIVGVHTEKTPQLVANHRSFPKSNKTLLRFNLMMRTMNPLWPVIKPFKISWQITPRTTAMHLTFPKTRGPPFLVL